MFTIGPSLYATLVSIKGLKANFTLILALSYTRLGFIIITNTNFFIRQSF